MQQHAVTRDSISSMYVCYRKHFEISLTHTLSLSLSYSTSMIILAKFGANLKILQVTRYSAQVYISLIIKVFKQAIIHY